MIPASHQNALLRYFGMLSASARSRTDAAQKPDPRTLRNRKRQEALKRERRKRKTTKASRRRNR